MTSPDERRPHEADEGLLARAPGSNEPERPDLIDDIVPTRGYQMTPVVALGGSAGSIAPLQEFFRGVPADSGLAFVVVIHLSPTHESQLPQILGRSTPMPVVAATADVRIEPNTVYVIPPGKELTTVDGRLRITDMTSTQGRRVVVDLLLRSLADTYGPHAAAVILSGADGDGALGIKRIKERGGLTLVQDPEESDSAGMPSAALDTGMIDWILPVKDMPARIVAYFHREARLRLPAESEAEGLSPPADSGEAEQTLRSVLVLLRARTGHDFTAYKRATIVRRLARRMQVNHVDDVADYLSFLRTHPGEAGALLQELLISVTNFFRDRDAFAALETHIPSLFAHKTQSDAVRVWIPACATGEEAYSIAILLLEHARTLAAPPTLQVFACDLNQDAIAQARVGVFPPAIEADVSQERLQRYFVKEHGRYLIRREVREMVLFAVHDVLKDPPFSRMELISCRNLLIYLNGDGQRRVLDTFHFALRPRALLFLGSSESVDEDTTLYEVVDKKHRIYRHRPSARFGLPVSSEPGTLKRIVAEAEGTAAPLVHGRRFLHDASSTSGSTSGRIDVAGLHFKALEHLGPPSVLVNAEYEIVHLSESAGRFLSFAGGPQSSSLLRAVPPSIRAELRAALFRAAESKSSVTAQHLPFEVDGRTSSVDVRVQPVPDAGTGYLLVLFDRKAAPEGDADMARDRPQQDHGEPAVRQLERELEHITRELRDTVERYEASTEEMKARNEELQAMNEELRSATEELETSREELQSVNEELATVNAEMKSKVDELAGANSDLQNLMASTAIATVFLDRDLAITRYTPNAVELFNLIPTDLGRPLAHLKHRLDYPELLADAGKVLGTLVPSEREVRTEARWFLVRLQPYRTLDDHIAGVVLTCVDVTDRKDAEQALHDQVEELTRFNAAAVDRELRMIELKKGVNALRARLGEPPAYRIDFAGEARSSGDTGDD